VKWSDEVAAGGLSIVNEAYRGRGIGEAFFVKAKFLEPNVTHLKICLTGTMLNLC
jgi:hypothetical protein